MIQYRLTTRGGAGEEDEDEEKENKDPGLRSIVFQETGKGLAVRVLGVYPDAVASTGSNNCQVMLVYYGRKGHVTVDNAPRAETSFENATTASSRPYSRQISGEGLVAHRIGLRVLGHLRWFMPSQFWGDLLLPSTLLMLVKTHVLSVGLYEQ